jgi:hypothetical protein
MSCGQVERFRSAVKIGSFFRVISGGKLRSINDEHGSQEAEDFTKTPNRTILPSEPDCARMNVLAEPFWMPDGVRLP